MQNVFQSCPIWRDQAGEFITKCINYAILLSAFYKHVNEITYIGNPVKSVCAVFQRSFLGGCLLPKNPGQKWCHPQKPVRFHKKVFLMLSSLTLSPYFCVNIPDTWQRLKDPKRYISYCSCSLLLHSLPLFSIAGSTWPWSFLLCALSLYWRSISSNSLNLL